METTGTVRARSVRSTGSSFTGSAVSTFATREECAVALHQQAQALEKMGLRVSEEPGVSFNGADADRTMRGQCLAESVDPRTAAAK